MTGGVPEQAPASVESQTRADVQLGDETAEIARVVVAAGFWLAALNDEMRVEASKTAGAGVSEQAQALVGLHDSKMQRLAERNAELERTLAEIRSQPLVRLAASVRRRLRPTPS